MSDTRDGMLDEAFVRLLEEFRPTDNDTESNEAIQKMLTLAERVMSGDSTIGEVIMQAYAIGSDTEDLFLAILNSMSIVAYQNWTPDEYYEYGIDEQSAANLVGMARQYGTANIIAHFLMIMYEMGVTNAHGTMDIESQALSIISSKNSDEPDGGDEPWKGDEWEDG